MLRWEQFGVGDDKHFAEKHICIDEWRRPSALDCVAIMGSSPEERFNRIARIAKNLIKVSITLITFIDAGWQWFETHLSISEIEGLRASSFCNLTITEDRVLLILDSAEDDRFHKIPMVTGSPHIRFYAGAPISTTDGQRLGTLCLVDTMPRILDADDLQSIRDIASCIQQELTQTDGGAVYGAHHASRFSAMVESVSDAILGLDEKVPIRSANFAVRKVFHYSPEGGTITVGCKKTDPGSVTLVVTDTGIGISAKDIPTVLEPFDQVRHDLLHTRGGTGLGLTLSKHPTEMHGGTLEIESAPGEGTTVIVILLQERIV